MHLREFYGIASAFYDADYAARGYTEDIRFYVDQAVASGGPVLEMGCGTGRILLPTARAGVRIYGMDQSRGMLRELRKSLAIEPPEVRRRVTVAVGDIRRWRAGRRFALVTAPFRVAQHLLTRRDQRAWLRNVRRHLAPGGALCFDVFQPNYQVIARQKRMRPPVLELERIDENTGARVRRIARTVSHPEVQLVDIHFRWTVEDRRGRRLAEKNGSFTFRWFTRGELENLLELEGFRITDYWGGFRRQAFGERSQHQVIRAVTRRPDWTAAEKVTSRG